MCVCVCVRVSVCVCLLTSMADREGGADFTGGPRGSI